jgi:hypothetical protein
VQLCCFLARLHQGGHMPAHLAEDSMKKRPEGQCQSVKPDLI